MKIKPIAKIKPVVVASTPNTDFTQCGPMLPRDNQWIADRLYDMANMMDNGVSGTVFNQFMRLTAERIERNARLERSWKTTN